MSDAEEDQGPPAPKGLPPYLATFADLMALLMCFFVLLLSFSQMDLSKFKKVAGSMENAFGVQREIIAYEIPKGTSVIAREFSPGKPDPTPLNEIRQKTIEELRQTLEFDEVRAEGDIKRKAEFDKTTDEQSDGEVDNDKQSKLEEMAAEIAELMMEEIIDGLLEIEVYDQRLIIRILEQGSFASGEATLRLSFLPVLNKIRKLLAKMHGSISIEGHTDNIPIYTTRFRSNWELSAARAVSVAHQLLEHGSLEQSRISISGFADTKPLFPNDTKEHRGHNRRVEIVLNQNEMPEDKKLKDELKKQPVKQPTQRKEKQKEVKIKSVRSISTGKNDLLAPNLKVREKAFSYSKSKLFSSQYLKTAPKEEQ